LWAGIEYKDPLDVPHGGTLPYTIVVSVYIFKEPPSPEYLSFRLSSIEQYDPSKYLCLSPVGYDISDPVRVLFNGRVKCVAEGCGMSKRVPPSHIPGLIYPFFVFAVFVVYAV
jgi:hypothetical protein